ncbi:hypothetical protein Tco_0671292 [Tanacetum coccineum]
MRSGKEVESSKEPTHKESKSTSSSKGASGTHPKSLGKSAQTEEHGQKVNDLEEQPHQEFNTGNDDATPVREVQNVNERQWNPSSSLMCRCIGVIYDYQVLEGYTDASWISNTEDNSSTSGWKMITRGRSRHLDVTHSMIRELIMNGVISIEFVRSQQNFADHLTMGLARDLVIKSAKGLDLKSNYVENARTPNSLLRKLGS